MSREFKHHKYTWTKTFGSPRHNWEVVGPNGAVNFHVTTHDQHEPTAGLEFHSLSGDGAPDHRDCPLTGGRCWHDGTSLYATEQLWPEISMMLRIRDHEAVFRVLEREYARYFSGEKVTVLASLSAIEAALSTGGTT